MALEFKCVGVCLIVPFSGCGFCGQHRRRRTIVGFGQEDGRLPSAGGRTGLDVTWWPGLSFGGGGPGFPDPGKSFSLSV